MLLSSRTKYDDLVVTKPAQTSFKKNQLAKDISDVGGINVTERPQPFSIDYSD